MLVLSIRPVEDFSQSLSELGAVLSVPVQTNDPVLLTLVRDARIYAFLRCSEVFRDFLQELYEASDYYHDEHESCDAYVEHLLAGLCLVGVLNEQQLRRFMSQFCMCAFFSIDQKEIFDMQEEKHLFQKGVDEIPAYYHAMCEFFEELSKDCELIACDDEAPDEH